MKNSRKYLVFPITYLILELIEDYVKYKSEAIEDIYIRTGVVMLTLVLGISLLAFILMPFFEGGFDHMRKKSKKHGAFVDLLVSSLTIGMLYMIYYIKINNGIEAILPPFMLN